MKQSFADLREGVRWEGGEKTGAGSDIIIIIILFGALLMLRSNLPTFGITMIFFYTYYV